MRIVGGTDRGRKLQVPRSMDIRPTSDKIRGAIFNALEARGAVNGAQVLDCFCGTGALGFEALSRGADHATFWDNHAKSLALAKQNAQELDVTEQSKFQKRDASASLSGLKGQSYDLVFLDPPYRKDLIPLTLQSLMQGGLLADDAFAVLEMEKDHDPNPGASFIVHFDKSYGDTRVMIIQNRHKE